jgi:hypothetical protein
MDLARFSKPLVERASLAALVSLLTQNLPFGQVFDLIGRRFYRIRIYSRWFMPVVYGSPPVMMLNYSR